MQKGLSPAPVPRGRDRHLGGWTPSVSVAVLSQDSRPAAQSPEHDQHRSNEWSFSDWTGRSASSRRRHGHHQKSSALIGENGSAEQQRRQEQTPAASRPRNYDAKREQCHERSQYPHHPPCAGNRISNIETEGIGNSRSLRHDKREYSLSNRGEIQGLGKSRLKNGDSGLCR